MVGASEKLVGRPAGPGERPTPGPMTQPSAGRPGFLHRLTRCTTILSVTRCSLHRGMGQRPISVTPMRHTHLEDRHAGRVVERVPVRSPSRVRSAWGVRRRYSRLTQWKLNKSGICCVTASGSARSLMLTSIGFTARSSCFRLISCGRRKSLSEWQPSAFCREMAGVQSDGTQRGWYPAARPANQSDALADHSCWCLAHMTIQVLYVVLVCAVCFWCRHCQARAEDQLARIQSCAPAGQRLRPGGRRRREGRTHPRRDGRFGPAGQEAISGCASNLCSAEGLLAGRRVAVSFGVLSPVANLDRLRHAF